MMARFISKLFGKSKRIEEKEELTGELTTPSSFEVGKMAFESIKAVAPKIKNEQMIKNTITILDLNTKIFLKIGRDLESINHSKRFFTYILPTTEKLLVEYQFMESQGISGENIKIAMNEIEEKIAQLIPVYEQYLDNLFIETALDLKADMDVMTAVLQSEGLVENEQTLRSHMNVENEEVGPKKYADEVTLRQKSEQVQQFTPITSNQKTMVGSYLMMCTKC